MLNPKQFKWSPCLASPAGATALAERDATASKELTPRFAKANTVGLLRTCQKAMTQPILDFGLSSTNRPFTPRFIYGKETTMGTERRSFSEDAPPGCPFH